MAEPEQLAEVVELRPKKPPSGHIVGTARSGVIGASGPVVAVVRPLPELPSGWVGGWPPPEDDDPKNAA